MEAGSASRTAQLVAAYRARATSSGLAGCHDRWAEALAGTEGPGFAAGLDAVAPHMGLWVAVRTAHLDVAVGRLLAAGATKQVVILGAGLDTRAARLARPGVRFFEVDAPASAQLKRARLAELEAYPVEAATYVTCDFEHEDFLERLVGAGFDPATPTAVVWEGVTYYLSEGAVRGTLARIASACSPRTTVLFDFVGKRFIEGRTKSAVDTNTLDMVRGLGEPMVWGINDVLPLLYEEGFRRVRVDSFDALTLRYTESYERERRFRFQYIAEASVVDPEQP